MSFEILQLDDASFRMSDICQLSQVVRVLEHWNWSDDTTQQSPDMVFNGRCSVNEIEGENC